MAQQKFESRHEPNAKPLASGSQLIDPVCGMHVTEDSPQHVQHKGESFCSCSIKCFETFKRDPKKFTVQRDSDEKNHEQVAPGTIYTCPIHPEIRLEYPGSCPKCGMALEPQMPSLDDDNPELKDFSLRFWCTLPFTVVVTMLATFGARDEAHFQRPGAKGSAYAQARPYRRGSTKRLVIDGIASVELDLCARRSSKLISIFPGVRQ